MSNTVGILVALAILVNAAIAALPFIRPEADAPGRYEVKFVSDVRQAGFFALKVDTATGDSWWTWGEASALGLELGASSSSRPWLPVGETKYHPEWRRTHEADLPPPRR